MLVDDDKELTHYSKYYQLLLFGVSLAFFDVAECAWYDFDVIHHRSRAFPPDQSLYDILQ